MRIGVPSLSLRRIGGIRAAPPADPGLSLPFAETFDGTAQPLSDLENWTHYHGGTPALVALTGSGGLDANDTTTDGTAVLANVDLSAVANYYVQSKWNGRPAVTGPMMLCHYDTAAANKWVGVRFPRDGSGLQVIHRDGATFTTLGSTNPGFAVGDVYRLEVSGGNITVKRNGGQILGPIAVPSGAVAAAGILSRLSAQGNWWSDFEVGSL